jgi:dimethylargininase
MAAIKPRALIRQPSPNLADGIVTHIARRPVDLDQARQQHDAYADALRANGWETVEVDPAPQCPDSVFIEDALVVCDDLAIVTRLGAPQRRAETPAAEKAARELGLRVARIEEPGTLDGGDVLQTGETVYIGQSGRTNAAGIDQLRALVPHKKVVPVPLEGVLHLKSAVTALPDGVFLNHSLVPDEAFPGAIKVPEESGAHVVLLGGRRLLIAASAPRTAELLAGRGWEPVAVDIGEYEKLEGCVTCLCVLVSHTGADTAP